MLISGLELITGHEAELCLAFGSPQHPRTRIVKLTQSVIFAVQCYSSRAGREARH